MFYTYIIVDSSHEYQKKINEMLATFSIQAVDILNMQQETVGIEDVLKVQAFLSRKPFASTHKAAIVSVDGITLTAQQAFLKTLEEPPQNSFIILCTSTVDTLIPTIQSRAVVIINHHQSKNQLDETKKAEIAQFWTKALKISIGERLKETEKIAKDRAETQAWIEEQIVYFNELLPMSFISDEKSSLKPIQITQILKLLLTTHELVGQNINLKLSIDHLFLKLPKIERN